MVIRIHMALIGVSPFKRQVKIKVPEGATVKEALEIYRQKYRAEDILGSMGGISILVNGSRGGLEQKLKDKDSLKVFKPMIRG